METTFWALPGKEPGSFRLRVKDLNHCAMLLAAPVVSFTNVFFLLLIVRFAFTGASCQYTCYSCYQDTGMW